MLKQRIFTALALLAVLLPALFYPSPWPFCFAALVLLTVAAWEWGRLNDLGQSASVALGLVCAAMCAASWYAGWLTRPLPLLWGGAGLLWVLVGGWLLRRGVSGWRPIPQSIRLTGGLLVLWMAWLAVAQARVIGIHFLLSLLLLVWVADVGAYFAGRSLGGRFSKEKLAPSISPGKTWEGVCGGVAGVLLMALIWWWSAATPAAGSVGGLFRDQAIYTRLAGERGWALMLLAMVFLVAISVVGDLVESLIKRSAGVKDSSRLLPGHGGVLDRVDALLPTMPLALMLVSL